MYRMQQQTIDYFLEFTRSYSFQSV